MKSRLGRPEWKSKIKMFIGVSAALIAGGASAATFVDSIVPIRVRTAWCDNSPRIFVEFADASKNIWYPANAEGSKLFLATALAAKVAGQKMYFLGTDDTATTYCVTGAARLVQVFGVSDY